MKLQGVIITNRKNLCDNFDFGEFWNKRREFVNSVQKDIFFSPYDNSQKWLYSIVSNWINNLLNTEIKSGGLKVTQTEITRNSSLYKRKYTLFCTDELKAISESDISNYIGIVALYEMMGRELKFDIENVLSTLCVECLNLKKDFICVNTSETLKLKSISNEDYERFKNAQLRSVLIYNGNKSSDVSIIWNDKKEILKVRQCCRSVFCGEICMALESQNVGYGIHYQSPSLGESGIEVNGTLVSLPGNVLSIVANKDGYVCIIDVKGKKFIAKHHDIDDIELNNIFPKDEDPIYLIMNPIGKDILILTNKKNVYRYFYQKDKLELFEKDVLMAFYDGTNIKVLKQSI